MAKKLSPLGEALQAAYKSKGMTRADFARAVGTNYPSVYSWETGSRIPGEKSITRIAQASGLPIHEIAHLCGKDPSGFLRRVELGPTTSAALAEQVVQIEVPLMLFLASGDASPVSREEIEYLRTIKASWKLTESDYLDFLAQYRASRDKPDRPG